MRSVEKTAKTVNEAVDTALAELGVTIDCVDCNIIDIGSKGFFGIGARLAKVIVTEKKSFDEEMQSIEEDNKKYLEEKSNEESITIKAESNETEKVQEIKETKVNDEKDIIKRAEAFLTDVFNTMNINVTFESKMLDKKMLNINIIGKDMGVIIGKRGQTLDSLQYILSLVVNKGDSHYVSISLDTENYRTKRKETLEKLAFNLAKKAKHINKNVILEPMNPYERRIIHSTLQNDKYITTFSEGEEPFRYIVISPKK